MVLSAGRIQSSGSSPLTQRICGSTQSVTYGQPGRVHVDPHPALPATCPRSCTRPSLMSIIESRPAARLPAPRRSPGAASGARPAAPAGSASPACSSARPAAEWPSTPDTATRSPGPGPGPGDRRPARQVAQRGHRQHDQWRAGHVPARHAGPGPAALLGQPGRHLLRPGHRQVRRARPGPPGARSAPRPSPRCRPGSARRPCRRFPGGGPLAAEMPALDEQIGAGDHAAVRGGRARPRRRRCPRACPEPAADGPPAPR